MIRAAASVAVLALCCFAAMSMEAGFSGRIADIIPLPEQSKVVVMGRCTWTTLGIENTAVTIHGEMTVTPNNTFSSIARCVGKPYCNMLLKPPYIASTT